MAEERIHHVKDITEAKAEEFKLAYFASRRRQYLKESLFTKHFDKNTKQWRIADLLNWKLSIRGETSITDEQICQICNCSLTWVYVVRQKLIELKVIKHERNSKCKQSWNKFIYFLKTSISEFTKIVNEWSRDFLEGWKYAEKKANLTNAPPDPEHSVDEKEKQEQLAKEIEWVPKESQAKNKK